MVMTVIWNFLGCEVGRRSVLDIHYTDVIVLLFATWKRYSTRGV